MPWFFIHFRQSSQSEPNRGAFGFLVFGLSMVDMNLEFGSASEFVGGGMEPLLMVSWYLRLVVVGFLLLSLPLSLPLACISHQPRRFLSASVAMGCSFECLGEVVGDNEPHMHVHTCMLLKCGTHHHCQISPRLPSSGSEYCINIDRDTGPLVHVEINQEPFAPPTAGLCALSKY